MRHSMIAFAVLTVVCYGSGQAWAANNAQTITFSSQLIRAGGFRPGATVVFFAVIVEPAQNVTQVHQWIRIVDDTDHDGVVTADFGRPVPVETVCAAFDVQTGDYAVAWPRGAVVELLSPAYGRFHKRNGTVSGFALGATTMAMMYVHPGHGVWRWSAVDGAPSDPDGPNGITNVTVDQATPLQVAYGKPTEFVPGGILVAVDWHFMRVLAMRLDEATLAGAQ